VRRASSSSGTALVRFDHGHGAGADAWCYYLADHIGSNDILMSSEGLPVEQNLYFPFGSEAKGGRIPSASWDQLSRGQRGQRAGREVAPSLHGKYLDDETGLYYFGARYYHPKASVAHHRRPARHRRAAAAASR